MNLEYDQFDLVIEASLARDATVRTKGNAESSAERLSGLAAN
jgi:hypothetical protein